MRAMTLVACALFLGSAPAAEAPDPSAAVEQLRAAVAAGDVDGLRVERLVPGPEGKMVAEDVPPAEAAALFAALAPKREVALDPGESEFLGVGARVPPRTGLDCYGTFLFAVFPAVNPADHVRGTALPVALPTPPICWGTAPPQLWSSVVIDLHFEQPWFSTYLCADALVTIVGTPGACERDGWAVACAAGEGSVYTLWGFGNSFIWWLGGASAVSVPPHGTPARDCPFAALPGV